MKDGIFGMTDDEKRAWLEKIKDIPEPEGCPACGAIAGCCDKYPSCPGNPQWTLERGSKLDGLMAKHRWRKGVSYAYCINCGCRYRLGMVHREYQQPNGQRTQQAGECVSRASQGERDE